MKKIQKIEIVESLKEKVASAKSLVLADYRGLTHQQLEEIKKAVKKVDGEFVITKNTLLSRSLLNTNYQLPTTDLKGPLATLLSYGDALAPLSVLAKFIKNFNLPKIKLGLLENRTYNETEVLALAALPSREVLAGTLVFRLKAPIYKLHTALNWNLTKLAMVLKAATAKVSS